MGIGRPASTLSCLYHYYSSTSILQYNMALLVFLNVLTPAALHDYSLKLDNNYDLLKF